MWYTEKSKISIRERRTGSVTESEAIAVLAIAIRNLVAEKFRKN